MIKLLLIANNDLQSIEQKCQDLKREEAAITAKNLNAARTFQQLSNDISEESKILEECRSSYRNEHLELSKLRIEKVNLESIVKQIKNHDEGYLKVKDIVKRVVEDILTNYRYLLNLVFQSVIDSCRSDPIKFNILYYNLPADTMETPVILSNWSNQYSHGLSVGGKLSYPYSNNNNNVYVKFLLDEAEEFFKEGVKKLTQVCISRLAEVCISASTSPQLDKKSYLNSGIAPSIQTSGIKKEDPPIGTHML